MSRRPRTRRERRRRRCRAWRTGQAWLVATLLFLPLLLILLIRRDA